ncbi:hypothetical protein ACFWPJ_27735, partial [Nocardia sp. NPDC058497]
GTLVTFLGTWKIRLPWCPPNSMATSPSRRETARCGPEFRHITYDERARGATTRNANGRIGAKVPSNHGAILRKDFRAIADSVREVAALDQAGK